MKNILVLATLLIPLSTIADISGHMGMSKGSNDMPMNTRSQEDSMKKMQDRIKVMIKQMSDLNATNDFDKRDELIAGHIDNMNKGIKEMRGMGGNMMKHLHGETKDHAMKGYIRKKPGIIKADPSNMSHMSERMESIEDRLDMLQIMLEQLIESRQAERAQRHGHL